MTATTLSQDAQSTPATVPASRTSRALTARRAFLIASPVLAGALALVGALADPAAGLTGRDMLQLYIDNPDPLQLKSFGFRWSYAFWIIPALLLVPYVRGKGAWLANVAGLLGFVGVSTLPGLLISDYFDSAVGQVGGIETALEVQQLIGTTMWGMPAITTPGMIGFMLALPLAAVAAWRAGLVRWVAPVAVVAAQLAFLLSNVTWWGCVITLLCFVGFAVELARGTAAHRVA